MQLRRVGGQRFQPEPCGRPGREELLHRPAAMDRRAIPDHLERAGNLAEQLAQEVHNGRSAERLILDAGDELARAGYPADHRAMVGGERRPQDRGLAARGIGARHNGQQRESRFVYEQDGAVLRAGFASRAGQRSACHAVIAASLRWVARTTGFCTLKPCWRSSRLRWAGW